MNLLNKVRAIATGGFVISTSFALFSYLNNKSIHEQKTIVKFEGGPLFKKCVKEIKIVIDGVTREGACRFLYGSR